MSLLSFLQVMIIIKSQINRFKNGMSINKENLSLVELNFFEY